MIIGTMNYHEMYFRNLKCVKSRFWEKIGLPDTIRKKTTRHIVIWEMPWKCQTVVLSEYFAYVLLFLAIVQYGYLRLRGLPGSDFPLLRIRMFTILERLPILGSVYKKVQKAHQDPELNIDECIIAEDEVYKNELKEIASISDEIRLAQTQ